MDGMLFPILIALAVALVVFVIVQVTAKLTDGERKKLKQRLSTELRPDAVGGGPGKQITIQEMDLGALGNFSPLEKLGKKLMQAYPDVSLGRFLSMCALIAVVVFFTLYFLMGPIVGGIAAVVLAYVPVIVVNMKRNKR